HPERPARERDHRGVLERVDLTDDSPLVLPSLSVEPDCLVLIDNDLAVVKPTTAGEDLVVLWYAVDLPGTPVPPTVRQNPRGLRVVVRVLQPTPRPMGVARLVDPLVDLPQADTAEVVDDIGVTAGLGHRDRRRNDTLTPGEACSPGDSIDFC